MQENRFDNWTGFSKNRFVICRKSTTIAHSNAAYRTKQAFLEYHNYTNRNLVAISALVFVGHILLLNHTLEVWWAVSVLNCTVQQ